MLFKTKKTYLTFNILNQLIDIINKNTSFYFFQKIYGLKSLKNIKLLNKLGFSINIKIYKIPKNKFDCLKKFLDFEGKKIDSFKIDINFKKNYTNKLDIYKAKKLKRGLPCNGQRTHSNGKTTKRLFKSNIQQLNKKEIKKLKKNKNKK